ncbi:MAG: geranylgeranylglyceryl/heptaprenylglyceryl phosphate synthase [bacterium]
MTVYEKLLQIKRDKGAGYLVLIDPDRLATEEILRRVGLMAELGVDALLIGGSLLFTSDFNALVKGVKEKAKVPTIIFPGSTKQISRHADAIFFLSLVSGRNPTYLIGEQVVAAPIIKDMGIEPIPTGYILIESGKKTTVEFMSNTQPIPRDKPEIVKAHALAAQYLGMKLVYLEGGSGAKHSVPEEVIRAVCDYVSIPIVVGGGIKTPEVAHKKVQAGASFVVIGTALEREKNIHLMQDFSDAIHLRKVASAASTNFL